MSTRKTKQRDPASAARPRRAAHAASERDSEFRLGRVPVLSPDSAFFLDLDGTLLEIADRPHQVRIDGKLLALLADLRQAAGGAFALVSGRSLADVDGLFAPLEFCVAGQHGAERRDAAGKLHAHRPPPARLRAVGHRLRDIAAEHRGLDLEEKGVNFAMHYRLAPEHGPMLRRTMRSMVRELGSGFEIQEGKMVFEIKPAGVDKGAAILEYMRESPFRGRTPVFIGDDRTDEFGFRAINRLGGYSVKVGRGATEARWRLTHAAAVRAWLTRFVDSVSNG